MFTKYRVKTSKHHQSDTYRLQTPLKRNQTNYHHASDTDMWFLLVGPTKRVANVGSGHMCRSGWPQNSINELMG